MSRILNVAQSPPTSVSPQATVLDAVDAMARDRVGAIAVMDGEKLQGIFTERDVMLRVVLKRLDPAKTPVSQVMTSNVVTVEKDVEPDEALSMMIQRHIRHLPISEGTRVLGMLSIRNLLQDRCETLASERDSLAAYIGADGPGG